MLKLLCAPVCSVSIVIPILACALAAGCGNGEVIEQAYDPEWGAQAMIATGKADGLVDLAQELTFEAVVSGRVSGEQLDLYRIDLKAGDTFKVLLTVESGDLNPHVMLFRGANTYVSSQEWSLTGQLLTKDYAVDFGGRHVLVVRAYQGDGAGKYTMSTTCTGGPCNGEVVIDPEPEGISPDQAGACIGLARECALDRVGRYDGAVGDVRSKELWAECMAEAALDHGATSCQTACDGEEQAALCEGIRTALIFYADRTEACRTLVNDCMGWCYEAGGDGTAEEFWTSAEAVCWENGFNGTCDGYARGHATCDGTEYAADTYPECYAACESTAGAWTDDLDMICTEECEIYCEDLWETCNEECGPDSDDCAQNCVDYKAPDCLSHG